MGKKVKLELTQHHRDHVPGDVITVDEDEAAGLLRTKRAVPVREPRKAARTTKKAASPRRAHEASTSAEANTTAPTE